MSFTAVSSLVGQRSSRPAFFFPSEFTKSSGNGGSSTVSSVSVSSCSNREDGDTQHKEPQFHVPNSFGTRLAGIAVSTRNAFDKPFKAEGHNALKPSAGMVDDTRTFLKEYASFEMVSETKYSLQEDIPTFAFKTELYPRCKSSHPEVTEHENSKMLVPSISCPNLVTLMVNPESVMIVDCRNFMAYNANHITGAVNVNLANKITRKRFVDGHLTISDLVSGTGEKAEYKRKERMAVIVVYDDNTVNVTSLPAAHPLKLLANRLRSEGQDVRYLEGGIQSFQTSYRQFCQHPDAPQAPPFLYSPTSQDVDGAVDGAAASQILPFMYIGNERDASNWKTLQELGVTHVLNVTANIPFHFEDKIKCKRLQASDSGCQNLKQYFDEAIQFIESARVSNGTVLVHCQAGVSRSPTIVMAYIMARFGKSFQDTFSFIHNCRSIISPNLNFMGQLLEFGQRSDLTSLCVAPAPSECLHLAIN